ncbi:blast:LINE-1 retrotransposable element ORF2 protein [Mytilus galloprovincialis]|uniref:Blast:LINE-1 retrotransposable element ORF2 protein n=1 Tax=Mytilus galloprovincialis TaxID=29158 RepID=A0A8B6EJL7_MYTGA|nr:blast:LINE-1 retrotransposable element ORF2 protein [Mytilus galloprovincialis]
MGGDFNDILKINDTKNKKTKNKFDKPVHGLKTLIKYFKFIDIWRDKNPTQIQYTWRRKSGLEATRIDFFLVSKECKAQIVKADIRPIILKSTDHNGISLKIRTQKVNRGKGYWKLNSSILNDRDYCCNIEKLIKYYENKEKTTENIGILWDNFKSEVRDISLDFCKRKAKQKRDKIQTFENDLNKLNIKLDQSESAD